MSRGRADWAEGIPDPERSRWPDESWPVARVLARASARATEQQLAKGLPPLPHTSPHTLRRTYISIALVASSFDVKWVMAQVGHSDSRTTMDVYTQFEQRAKRDHGESFDRLVRQAREPGESPLAVAA